MVGNSTACVSCPCHVRYQTGRRFADCRNYHVQDINIATLPAWISHTPFSPSIPHCGRRSLGKTCMHFVHIIMSYYFISHTKYIHYFKKILYLLQSRIEAIYRRGFTFSSVWGLFISLWC